MIASRLFRSGFLLLPMLVAAGFAAACSDDDPATPGDTSDGGSKTDGPVTGDAGDGGAVVTDPRCATDLDKDGLYKHLACTGLYANATTKTVNADLMAYKPSTEFWSDGAEKQRWFYLPPGTKIETKNMDDWVFPVGTKVFKEFKLNGKRIETRLLQKFDDEWKTTTYRWNADETDAPRLEEGALIDGIGPDGGAYEIPNTTSCSADCHGGRKDFLLGFDAVSLGLPNATGLTLAQLVEKKMLTVDPPATTLAYPAATAAEGGDKAGPAMAWLHINCGSACHNRNTNAGANFTGLFMQIKGSELMPVDGGPVTVDKLDAYALTVCKNSNQPEVAPFTGTFKYVRSGLPTRSWVSIISGQRTPAASTQMPPIITHAVDTVGHKLLDDWITSLTPACAD
jgi:hypothetical protein